MQIAPTVYVTSLVVLWSVASQFMLMERSIAELAVRALARCTLDQEGWVVGNRTMGAGEAREANADASTCVFLALFVLGMAILLYWAAWILNSHPYGTSF